MTNELIDKVINSLEACTKDIAYTPVDADVTVTVNSFNVSYGSVEDVEYDIDDITLTELDGFDPDNLMYIHTGDLNHIIAMLKEIKATSKQTPYDKMRYHIISLDNALQELENEKANSCESTQHQG